VNYSILAAELLEKMQVLHKARPQKDIKDALQGEAFALNYIARHGEEVIPSEIGHEMNVSSARIAQTLNSIEKKGWITRQIDLSDRRRIMVRLTSEGRKEAEKHYQVVAAIAADMLMMLGEEDAKEYVRITGKLADVITSFKSGASGMSGTPDTSDALGASNTPDASDAPGMSDTPGASNTPDASDAPGMSSTSGESGIPKQK
jgi:DNA-binding MarR family transcriptional regulator